MIMGMERETERGGLINRTRRVPVGINDEINPPSVERTDLRVVRD